MENASKALLIAGEILIAMLVASMMVLLFSTMSSYADEHAEQRRVQEVQAFNATITQYAKAEKSTAQDIVSLVNFAKQVNEQNGCTGTMDVDHTNNHINIIVEPETNNMELYTEDQLRTFLQSISQQDLTTDTGLKYYEATIQEYSEDGRIRVIAFTE